MSTIDKAIRESVTGLPKSILQEFLARKLAEAGTVMPPDTLAAFTEHVLSKSEGGFIWDDESGKDRTLSLVFTAEDAKELDDQTTRVLDEIPRLVEAATTAVSKKLFRSLAQKWEVEYAAQLYELDEFRAHLEGRWGGGLDYLRMLLTCCREMGHEASRRYRRSRAKSFHYRRWVLERLHVRACQVSDEIICLVENGFADGAMARWRTLHEVSVVASLITKGDEDLAERYILHDAVEVKRQADDYDESQVPLGAMPLSKRQRTSIDAEYAAVIGRFGTSFAHPYGWASKQLNHKKPTFKELQMAAGRASSSSYYKLASFNIHAGARSLFFNLGSIGDEFVPIAGRSNAGLREPGELTAHALALVTSLYVGSSPNFDRIAMMNCLLEIRDTVSSSFQRAERQLARDDRALRSEATSQEKARNIRSRRNNEQA